MQLTPHFSLAELTITEVRTMADLNRRKAAEALPALTALAQLLEGVRTLLGGKPIVVHSGFRCTELNSLIGGSPTSQHRKGEAADFHVVGMPIREAFDKIRLSTASYGQCILEDGDGDGVFTWIHLSLGSPWRSASKCRQALIFDGRVYKSA